MRRVFVSDMLMFLIYSCLARNLMWLCGKLNLPKVVKLVVVRIINL